MRLSNNALTKRLLSLALATVFCISLLASPSASVSAAGSSSSYREPDVQVGIYVSAPLLDTRVFSSLNTSSGGFEIGYLNGESFIKLFSVSDKSVILLPQVNASFDSKNKTCSPSDNGSVGAYSAVLGRHSTYSAAYNAAKAVGGFVAVVKGGYEARAYNANIAAKSSSLSGGRPVASPVSGAITVVNASNGKILFTYEDTSRKLTLRGTGGKTVSFPVKHRSSAVNTFDYQGKFEYSVSEGKLWMVNHLGLEDYTKCVMANEIGTNVSVETRKAFAVLARTVPMKSKHGKQGYDVCCNSACCQVYYGTHRMSAENNAIVDSTRGLICTYKGTPIDVLYHNSNGGASCSSVAAWGGNEVPYLTTVFQEETEDSDRWQKIYSKKEFYDYLRSRNTFSGLKDEEISMKILETDPYGSDYITVLSVSDGSGNTVSVETSEDIRSACGFKSANFTLEYSTELEVVTSEGKVEKREIKGVLTADGYKPFEGFDEKYVLSTGETFSPEKVTVNGQGVGHGVGFSATGSEKLARDGYSYKYILGCFFNGTDLTYPK